MNVFIVMAILDIDVVKSAFIGVFSYSSKSVQSKILLCFLFRKNIEILILQRIISYQQSIEIISKMQLIHCCNTFIKNNDNINAFYVDQDLQNVS